MVFLEHILDHKNYKKQYKQIYKITKSYIMRVSITKKSMSANTEQNIEDLLAQSRGGEMIKGVVELVVETLKK